MDDTKSIELSRVVTSDLLSFNDSQAPVSVEAIEVLVLSVCDSLTKVPNPDQSNIAIRNLEVHKSLEGFDSQKIFQIYKSLSSLIVTAASENISCYELETRLKTLNWSPEQVTTLVKIFSANLTKIQAVLKLFGTKPPKLVDVNWRLDFQLETNTRGPVHELLYIIELTLDNNGTRENLSFTASHAELEDLVNTLRDACQCAKRVALL